MEYGNIQVAAAPVKKDKRKLATAREKRRMEKLNHCIEDLRVLICPSLKGNIEKVWSQIIPISILYHP